MTAELDAPIGSRERRLGLVVDEIRADVVNGLVDAGPDDVERLRRVRSALARIMAMIDPRDAETIEAAFAADVAPRTPMLGVILVLNDQRRGLLVRRGDDGVHRIPRAFVDPALDPEAAVRRLAADVIGEGKVLPVPHGLCDSIAAGLPHGHTYYLTYVADATFLDGEEFGLVPLTEGLTVDPLTEYLVSGAERTVLEAPFAPTPAVRAEFAAIRGVAAGGAAAHGDDAAGRRFARIVDTMDLLLDSLDNDAPLREHDFGLFDVVTPATAAEAVVLDGGGRILLSRAEDGRWSMPGGPCEVGETSAATAVRRVEETLGFRVDVEGLAGVYPDGLVGVDGDSVSFVYVVRPAEIVHAVDPVDPAIVEARWFAPGDVDGLPMAPGHDVKVARALTAAEGAVPSEPDEQSP